MLTFVAKGILHMELSLVISDFKIDMDYLGKTNGIHEALKQSFLLTKGR